jgi:Kef-type K+ transport system membrane component KefB
VWVLAAVLAGAGIMWPGHALAASGSTEKPVTGVEAATPKCADAEVPAVIKHADGVEKTCVEALACGIGQTQTKSQGSVVCATAKSAEELFGRLMVAIAVVILAARLLGSAVGRIGQPPVMGEVLAGILLGPTLLGRLLPDVEGFLFPFDIVPLITAAANIGLAYFMFLVGLELNPSLLKGKVRNAAIISNVSVICPFAMGLAVGIPLYAALGPDHAISLAPISDPPHERAFVVFVGVSMSITAFPVLARILIERRMINRPIGAIALASAAVDDVTAWTLLALATALAMGKPPTRTVQVVALAAVFAAVMATVGRRVLRRVAVAFDEAGHVPLTWLVGLFVAIPFSAYVTQRIGVAAIFGPFVLGLVMPHLTDLSEDVSRRLHDFVTTVLLPLFFVVTGLRTEILGLDTVELWLICLGLIAIAIAGKWGGAMLTARAVGYSWRESTAIGALMNTRGLTELIVLNIGFTLGVIPQQLFTMLVLMAIVTTFIAAPSLRLIDPRGTFSTSPEDELRVAEPASARDATLIAPERAVLVATQDAKNLPALVAVAELVARSQPPRELVLARLVPASRAATGITHDNDRLAAASIEINELRSELIARGVPARSVAFVSATPGSDIARLASDPSIDMVLVDGARPIFGVGVPGGDVGTVLHSAPCDVAVLVERPGTLHVGPDAAVVVPFGGTDHDWAALELGAWIASARGATLKMLGAAARPEEGARDASRLLADASLAVQQMVNVPVESALVSGGAVVAAADGAGLLVVGLSSRWRRTGLGPVRSRLARSRVSTTIFVRRGTRTGALASSEELTRFTWSRV